MQNLQNLQEKFKGMLLLTDADIDPLLKGDFKTLLAQNREAAIRVGIAYGVCLIALLIFLALFSVFGAFMKIILTLVIFGILGGVAFLAGEENVLKATKYPAFSYFVIFIFAAMTWAMLSDISSMGSFFSKAIAFMIIAGLCAGAYTIRIKAAEKGFTSIQLTIVTLILSSLLLSFQAALVQFSVDRDIAQAQRISEARRSRDAEVMKMSQATSKACTTPEECQKMNTKKNSYYSDHEEAAQEACERTVAKEITSRFEWTVSPRDYKFTSYQVDVLKDEILLMGDRAQLISSDGTKEPVTYSCRYNTKKKTTSATVQKK